MWVDQIRGYCSCDSEPRIVPEKIERRLMFKRYLGSKIVSGSRLDARNERN